MQRQYCPEPHNTVLNSLRAQKQVKKRDRQDNHPGCGVNKSSGGVRWPRHLSFPGSREACFSNCTQATSQRNTWLSEAEPFMERSQGVSLSHRACCRLSLYRREMDPDGVRHHWREGTARGSSTFCVAAGASRRRHGRQGKRKRERAWPACA